MEKENAKANSCLKASMLKMEWVSISENGMGLLGNLRVAN